MSICVIIPMFGQEKYTRECIDLCISMAGIVHDIVVVDDCSPEPYEDDRVHVIRLEKNLGYTQATNIGILHAQRNGYDFVHLLNNDTEPRKDFIKILHDKMQEIPVLGIAGSARELPTNDEMKYELFGEDLIRGHQRVCNEVMMKGLPDIIYTRWVPLCSSLIRMDMIREIGLLDKHMRTWSSDNEYCFRATFADWNVALVPKSIVYHYHQVTTGKDIGEGVISDQKNLIAKMAGMKYAELMNEVPLDCESKVYGKVTFEVTKR